MKIIKRLVCSLCIVLCQACASTTEPVKYYSLTLNTDQREQAATIPVSALAEVAIEPVYLAKFLRQDGIVSQLGKNEITVANFHRWAEPLDEAIAKLLMKDLNNKTRQYHFSWRQIDTKRQVAYSLRLEMDKFGIKNYSNINIGGHYWLRAVSDGAEINQSFDITQHLRQDGYAHAVTQLQQAVARLADEIISALQQISGAEKQVGFHTP